MVSRDVIQGRVEGLEAARRALERVVRAEIGAIPEALDLVGQVATTETQRRAPVKTGRLRRSYTWEVGDGGRYVEIGSNLDYAPAQELGWRGGSGTPHLRPGIEATIPQIPQIIAEHLGRAGKGAAPAGGGLGSTLGAYQQLT